MSEETVEATLSPDDNRASQESEVSMHWGAGAPRGGRAVLNRILKDGAKVPLFLGQTLVSSLRDLGYNSTTSALCEHVDNAIQWGASEIRVYFHQTGHRGDFKIATLVYDNGSGMAPHVLKVATAFGGSLVYENRDGIGRYGMGMKTAALSMSPVFDLYSWQEPGAIYSMTVDVNEIGNSRTNLIELSDPVLNDQLPSDVLDILTKPMVFPKNPQESQTLLSGTREELRERMGSSGTIVFMPECDRLTFRKAQTLAEHATKEMARIYRRDRSFERRMARTYIEQLSEVYARFFESYNESALLKLETDHLDLVQDAGAQDEVISRISAALSESTQSVAPPGD